MSAKMWFAWRLKKAVCASNGNMGKNGFPDDVDPEEERIIAEVKAMELDPEPRRDNASDENMTTEDLRGDKANIAVLATQ